MHQAVLRYEINGFSFDKRYPRSQILCVVINKQCAWNTWFILYFGHLVKLFFPFGSLRDGGGIACVGNNDAAAYVAGKKWLESGSGVDVGSLVPELKPNLFAVYFHEF